MLAWISNRFRTTPARFQRKQPARARAAQLRLEALEDRLVPATLTVGVGKMFSTIQAAVNAAAASSTVADTIKIDPGTYNEQVIVPSTITATNSLVIDAANTSNKPTIKPTFPLTGGSNAIIDVNGAKGLTIQNLVIDGSGTSSAWFGVFVEQSGTATIQNNTIKNLTATASTGNDTGFGIRVGRSSLSGQSATTGTATITSNTITGYGKGGIDVANTGSSAAINGNTVTGLGHKVSDSINQVQNGIEIDDGATGTIGTTTGNTISRNGSARTGFGSAGILLYQPGSSVAVGGAQGGNTLSNNDVGIWVFDAASPTISNNNVSGSLYWGIAFDTAGGNGVTGANVTSNDSNNNLGEGMNIANTSGSTFSNNQTDSNGKSGLVLSTNAKNNTIRQNESKSNALWGILVADFNPNGTDAFSYLTTSTSTGNTISQNTFSGNDTSHTTGVYDAEDRSTGTGTGGTADSWSGNTIGTKKPSGLH
jgi:parallel beta-helix repeat protein